MYRIKKTVKEKKQSKLKKEEERGKEEGKKVKNAKRETRISDTSGDAHKDGTRK